MMGRRTIRLAVAQGVGPLGNHVSPLKWHSADLRTLGIGLRYTY